MQPLYLFVQGMRPLKTNAPTAISFSVADQIVIAGDGGADRAAIRQAIAYALYGQASCRVPSRTSVLVIVDPHDIWPSGQDSCVSPCGQDSCVLGLVVGVLEPRGRLGRCPFGRDSCPGTTRLFLPYGLPSCIGSFGKVVAIFPGRVYPRPDCGDASVQHLAASVGVGVVGMPAGPAPEDRLTLAVVRVREPAGVVAALAGTPGRYELDPNSVALAGPQQDGRLFGRSQAEQAAVQSALLADVRPGRL